MTTIRNGKYTILIAVGALVGYLVVPRIGADTLQNAECKDLDCSNREVLHADGNACVEAPMGGCDGYCAVCLDGRKIWHCSKETGKTCTESAGSQECGDKWETINPCTGETFPNCDPCPWGDGIQDTLTKCYYSNCVHS